MAYPESGVDPREGLFEHTRFRGLRNNVEDEGFGLDDLSTGLNIDIDDELEIKRRKGYSSVLIAGIDRSLWARGSVCLGVGSNALKLVNPDYTTTTLRSGLATNRELSYESVADRIYYANGVERGCVQNGQHRTWGLTPPGLPNYSVTSGTLLAGNYQVAITYMRSDGQESGTGRARSVVLSAAGGIALSQIPVSSDPTVTAKYVYATSVGGETLYRCGIIPNSQTTFTIAAIQADAQPLMTQFLQPPPPGDFIGLFKGWMLVAQDTRLYPSEEYSPELFDYRKAQPFLDHITMVAPLNNASDGVWIGTESQVIWMDGESPQTWKFKVAADHGVIPGTLSYADGETIGDGSGAGETAAIFATTRGVCLGKTGGTFANLTDQRFAYPSMDRGAGVVRKHRGMIQYLCTLEGVEVPGNVAA